MPIATQSAIVLPYDMEGNILNEIYNFDESVRMQYMHIAVFPLEDESVVLAFYHKRDKLYRQLRHQINSSSQEKVLQYINYLIFEHTENVYFSKKIEEEIKNNKMIEKLSQEANGLRKYDYNREDVYLSNVFDAIDKMYPEVGENINILREKFEKLNNYYMEVILSDGTSLNLYKAIEDVMYGLYLHADPDKIERLLKTNKNVYLMAVKEYIIVLEKIVIDTYNSIVDKMKNKYSQQEETSASVIFMGDSTNEKHDIKNSPYWKNLYGRDLEDTEIKGIFQDMSDEDIEIYLKGSIFLQEAYKEDYSVEKLEKLVFPWVRSDWGDFSDLHNFVIEKKNIGLSSRVQYNDRHDIAYLKIFQNVENAFVVEQPHQIPDIWILNFVKKNEKYGWRIYGIGDKIADYKESGSILDWFEHIKEDK